MGNPKYKIKESSTTKVYDSQNSLLKDGFVDVNDAQEYAINYLLNDEDMKKIVIRQTIEIRKV